MIKLGRNRLFPSFNQNNAINILRTYHSPQIPLAGHTCPTLEMSKRKFHSERSFSNNRFMSA